MLDRQAMVDEAIARLRNDHERGASALALEAAALLGSLAGEEYGQDPARQLAQVRQVCAAVGRARPSMASLAHVASRLWRATAAAPDARSALRAVTTAAQHVQAEAVGAPERMARHLAERLGEQARIVTLSRSATVTRALSVCRSQISAITVLESRPGGEGGEAAREFATWGAAQPDGSPSVQVVPDAAMLLALDEATAVVAGADALLASGYVVNKTGTHPLALAAHVRGYPVYILAEPLKIAPAAWQWAPEIFDASLVLPQPIPGVQAFAWPFEPVPLDLVEILAPTGPLTLEALVAAAEELDGAWHDLNA